jgi:hypothetical protein
VCVGVTEVLWTCVREVSVLFSAALPDILTTISHGFFSYFLGKHTTSHSVVSNMSIRKI